MISERPCGVRPRQIIEKGRGAAWRSIWLIGSLALTVGSVVVASGFAGPQTPGHSPRRRRS